jgi:VanZ family protein
MTASRYRGSLLVWLLLLCYASLYPFLSMRLPGWDAVAGFFMAPRYIIRSDIAFNIAAYVPLGMLATLYFRQGEGRHAVAKAIALGAGFSLAMEALQLFVPHRVASPLDLAANTGGALLGALVFVDPVYSVLTRPLGALREAVIIPGAWGDAGLVLVMLWLLAQLNPALPFFGAGDIGGEARVEIALLQSAAVGMSIAGFGLFVSVLVGIEQGSLRVTLVLLSIALWLKFLAASVLLQPHFSQEWVDLGRIAGMLGGIAAFVPLRKAPRAMRIYLALMAILAGALFSKIFGAYSPIEEFLRMFRWPHGQLGSFATLTRFLHELWPFAAVAFLVALFIGDRRPRPGLRMTP